MMPSELIFIYDGECPFCNKFAQLLELQAAIPNILIRNGRDQALDLSVFKSKDYDLDEGAILIVNEDILQGATAINYLCSQIENPSDSLLKAISIIFRSTDRVNLLFPLLLWSRRILLFFKGVPRKLVFYSHG